MQLPQPLVRASWLADHLDDVRIVDSRWYLDGRSGHAAYMSGHIPGAVWVDLDADLSSPATRRDGRHPLPEPSHFAAALGRLGIDQHTPVVVYDDARGSVAARLWWMLHALEQPVAVLDGGLAAWTGALDTDDVAASARMCTTRPWPATRFVDADEVDDLRTRSTALVIDARAAARYAHGDPAIDPRPGHIPGAKSAPWMNNVNDAGALQTGDALRGRFVELGADHAEVIVSYCGSGVTACHNLLALELAGYGDRTRLYPGSWSQWGADPARPAEAAPNA